MPTKEEFLAAPQRFVLLVLGMPDSGKSDLMMSFPGVYVIGFDETGFGILRNKTERSRQLADNLVHIEFPPLTADLFRETGKTKPDEPAKAISSIDRYSVFGCLKHVIELAKEEKIQTLGFDGLNYFVGAKWELICKDPKNLTSDGELNRYAAYNDLKNYLHRFMWSILLPTASRHGLNLIASVHIKRESPETLEGSVDKRKGSATYGQRISGGKVDRDVDLAPIIEGGFRNEIDGKFGGVIWLRHKPEQVIEKGEVRDIVTYTAYCKRIKAMDTIIPAKNKWGLPAKIDLTNKNFYEILLKQTATTTASTSTNSTLESSNATAKTS